MPVTSRILLAVTLACVWGALPACRGTRRVTAPCPGASTTCLPPMEAPTPVGTAVGEVATKDFVLRVHDVRDILDLMPVIQLVGPDSITTVPPENALIEALVRDLDATERPITELRGTDSGAVIVKGPPAVQEKVARSIHDYRTELVQQAAFRPPAPQAQPPR